MVTPGSRRGKPFVVGIDHPDRLTWNINKFLVISNTTFDRSDSSKQNMNRLPKVLQNEIWEYVHGDRAYWRNEFRHVMLELESRIPQYHLEELKKLQSAKAFRKHTKLAPNLYTYVRCVLHGHKTKMGPMFIVYFRRQPPGDSIEYWIIESVEYVHLTTFRHIFRFRKFYLTFEEARTSFHKQVLIAAREAIRCRDRSS